jgi:hypothetical protein
MYEDQIQQLANEWKNIKFPCDGPNQLRKEARGLINAFLNIFGQKTDLTGMYNIWKDNPNPWAQLLMQIFLGQLKPSYKLIICSRIHSCDCVALILHSSKQHKFDLFICFTCFTALLKSFGERTNRSFLESEGRINFEVHFPWFISALAKQVSDMRRAALGGKTTQATFRCMVPSFSPSQINVVVPIDEEQQCFDDANSCAYIFKNEENYFKEMNPELLRMYEVCYKVLTSQILRCDCLYMFQCE